MAITINWATRVISILKADMTQLSATRYELNVDALRLALKDLEDSEEGMAFPSTHVHNTTVTVGGVTLARVVEIVNGYTITFEAGTYSVSLVGANNNIADVMNLNSVSLRSANSAGLIAVGLDPNVVADAILDRANAIEAGLTPRQAMRLIVAALAGELSGAETTTIVIRNAVADSKNRITATVDVNGNRQAISYDLS